MLEAQTLREVLPAEKRLQQIMAKLEADGYMKPENVMGKTEAQTHEKLSFTTMLANMSSWLNWTKTPPLIPSLTNVLLITVALSIMGVGIGVGVPFLIAPPPDKPEPDLTPKSENLSPSSGSEIKYSDDDPQAVAEYLENDFKSAGAKVQVSQIGNKFQVDVKIPETPSDELRELCDEYNLDLEKIMSSTRSVRFTILPE